MKMRDYPNMSYCMFQNTEAAMAQILDAMRNAEATDGLASFYKDLSREERNSLQALMHACEEYLEATEALMEDLEAE
jgi:uncharacterized protein HemY